MAQVSSLKDGYINEVGVMSATVTSATSCLFKHNVLLPGGTITYMKYAAFTSNSQNAGILTGQLGFVDGEPGTLVLTGSAPRIRFGTTGGVIQVSGAASIPFGIKA